jgi:hypothetical protein
MAVLLLESKDRWMMFTTLLIVTAQNTVSRSKQFLN